MSILDNLTKKLPEVKGPEEKYLSFNTKLKWTLIILSAFYILSVVPLYGLGQNALSQFESLSILLGASFGSILSLGIGPIVTASIVLQLLVGSEILKFDTTTKEGRAKFQGVQKIAAIFFIIFEAVIYVILGGLAPASDLSQSTFFTIQLVLIFQLLVGGMIVLFMDEVLNKWGFGSGISLFIAAGVSSQIFVRILSPLTRAGTFAFSSGESPVGQLWVFLLSLIGRNPREAFLAALLIIFTILIFIVATYVQSMKVEIPLSFGRIRGHGIRWPLKFIYTSNIPVILIAALFANIQLWARLLESRGYPILGTFAGNVPVSGIVAWLFAPNLPAEILGGSFRPILILQSLVYISTFVIGSIIFSIFWVQTSGMNASSQAKQIINSGLQVPGFRRDQRVVERLLERYISPLTVMGAIVVGFLASTADLLGALSSGTGILLTVMIIYRLYEDISKQHMADINPVFRKMIE